MTAAASSVVAEDEGSPKQYLTWDALVAGGIWSRDGAQLVVVEDGVMAYYEITEIRLEVMPTIYTRRGQSSSGARHRKSLTGRNFRVPVTWADVKTDEEGSECRKVCIDPMFPVVVAPDAVQVTISGSDGKPLAARIITRWNPERMQFPDLR